MKVSENKYSLRIFTLAIVSILLIGLIGVRLFIIQVFSHDYYSELADNQHQLSTELTPERGEIYIQDRIAQIPSAVVVNVNRPRIVVNPQQVESAPELTKILSKALGLSEIEVLEKISDTNRKYVVIAKQVEEGIAESIKEMSLPGVYFENEIHQNYPEGNLLSQVLGFVAFAENSRVGRYGLEQYFEEELAGKTGFLKTETGLSLGLTPQDNDENTVVPAEDGVNLYLTIDRAIQFKVEEVLNRAVAAYGAKGGSVIVINPKTGAILAMANSPSFDPNNYNLVEDPAAFNNSSIQTAYEPGSVMKPITMAAAIEEEAVDPTTTFFDEGIIELEKFTIRNSDSKKYGEVSMTQVLEESINTGIIFAEQKLGHDKFTEFMENFGFGELTGINLPFEAKGGIDNLYRGGDLYPATIAYGQGMTATPLQIVNAFGVIANGGKLMKPYLVDEIAYSDGSRQKTKPEVVRQVISPRAASTVGAMIVSVVERGHGKRAGVPGYFIAGKTGTAQVAYENKSGYDPSRNIGTFAGFGPIDDPAFAMIVKINEPHGVEFAETTAAPAFGEIAQFILNYYQIPASR